MTIVIIRNDIRNRQAENAEFGKAGDNFERDVGVFGVPVLREGRIERFLGVEFIHSERLPTGTDDQSGTSTKVGFPSR